MNNARTYITLDTYDNRDKKFSSIMNPVYTELSLCDENELPEELKVLRLVSEVRKGESDFYNLQKVSPEELPPKQNYLKLMSDLRRKKLDFMDFLSLYSNGEMDKFADTYDYMWE